MKNLRIEVRDSAQIRFKYLRERRAAGNLGAFKKGLCLSVRAEDLFSRLTI